MTINRLITFRYVSITSKNKLKTIKVQLPKIHIAGNKTHEEKTKTKNVIKIEIKEFFRFPKRNNNQRNYFKKRTLFVSLG